MDIDKQTVLTMFKQGYTKLSIVDHMFYKSKSHESEKKKDERVKVDKKNIMQIVEVILLDDYMANLARLQHANKI